MDDTLRRLPGRKIRPSADQRTAPGHEHEGFEALLDDISTAMARTPAHEIDAAIKRWLREIVLALEVDRGTIWERASPNLGFVGTHWWARPGIPGLPRDLNAMKISPWMTGEALAGRAVVFSSRADLPKHDMKLREFLKRYGPEAHVMLPLEIGGVVVGALTCGKFRGPRDWPPNLVRRLRVVGQIIAGALDRKRTDLQTRRLQEEVTLAARRSTVGQLAASIAHELNQPLGAILSNVNAARRMVAGERPEPQEAVAALDDIAQDTKRAGDIIRRVRALFKDGNSPNDVLDMGTLLSEVEGLLRSEAVLRKVSMRIEAAPSVAQVVGDRIQLQQCILNLVVNAFDAMAAADDHRREVLVRVVQEEDDWVTVSVRDTGGGIDPAVGRRLFEPFVTSKPQGMGMGLVVTRSIVENHGGKISWKPNSDAGATFTFTLPALREDRRKKAVKQ
jgi:signal transduction histidine kinase